MFLKAALAIARNVWHLKMKRFSLIIITLLLCSCSIGKQGVFYEEMATTPKLTITDNTITIEIKNSIRNSALMLYKIETEVNKENKELILRGHQAINRKYKDKFILELDKLGIDDIEVWTVNWIDRDGSKHELRK